MSNRSLAAARSRRSPQEVVNNPLKRDQQMPQNNQKVNRMSKDSNNLNANSQQNKLSISDAIGLITIRLSKLESHFIKEKQEVQSTMNSNLNSSSVADVDTVIRNIVSRMNVLENHSETVDKNLEELNTTVKDLEESTPVNELLPPVSNQPDPFLMERIEKTEKDLSEVKQLVIKLQTMLIETTLSQKFSPPQPVSAPAPAPAPVPAPVSQSPSPSNLEEHEPSSEFFVTSPASVSVAI